eukprot:TRINITY_DN16394_c0_g1_i1.p1 TRINITY_DN16394_c0_g1~~TRINITY_DN16394_c0_g1_i1.p1  ORF type:complete len:271 (-),score=27.05 TRINITY_DN16394_c0_g1_i1:183-995(-)
MSLIPDTPVLVAGGFGGPCVMYAVTPMRNGLTLGAQNPQLSALSLYRQVFSRGVLTGWTGGIFSAVAACPQYLCVGPAYHVYASYVGVAGATVLTGFTESLMAYGAETRNAQLATNSKTPGRIANIAPVWKFGPGFGIHVFRNVLCVVGLRMFCTPCHYAIETVSGKRNAWTTLLGDFSGNVAAACLTAPVHQTYNFTVSTPELWTMNSADKRARYTEFLKDTYTEIGANGTRKISSVLPRDLFMRSMYVAVAFTMYSTLERALIANWPR